MKKKIALMVTSLVLVVAMAVGGTLAWLTDTDNEVNNTFTIGNVGITLDEADVDEYGVLTGNERDTANEYKLMPGHTYVKDPTIHVDRTSESFWLFVKVENGISAIEAADNTIAAQIAANGWTPLDGNAGVYYRDWTEGSTIEDFVVFGEFTIADDADISGYGNAAINITGYAIQKDGVADAATAWGYLND